MKKVISKSVIFLLSVLMLFSGISPLNTALAGGKTIKSGDFVYGKISSYFFSGEKRKIYAVLKYTGSDKTVTVPALIDGKRIEAIGEKAFMGNESIEEVKISEGIKYVLGDGDEYEIGAFMNCRNLKKVSFPESLEGICDYAFRNCSLSGTVKIGKNLRYGLETYFYTDGVPALWTAFGVGDKMNIKAFEISDKNKNYSSIDGVVFSKDKKTLIAYPKGKTDKNYYVPYGTTEISNAAFYANKYLKKLNISKSVTDIYGYAFIHCKNLSKIKINNPDCRFSKKTFSGFSNDCVLVSTANSTTERFVKKSGSDNLKFAILQDSVKNVNGDTQVADIVLTKVGKNCARISWAAVDKADKYRVYQSTDGKSWKKVRVVKGPTAKVSNLKSKCNYYFKVIANVNGKEVKSRAIKIKTK